MRLFKKGRIWYIDYTTLDGRRRRQSTKTTVKGDAQLILRQIETAVRMPTRSLAQEVLDHYYNETDKNIKQPKAIIPLDSIWSIYIRIARSVGRDRLSSDTIRKRRNAVERLTDWLTANRTMITGAEMVTGPIAASYAEYLYKVRALKTKTRRNIIGDLSTVWSLLSKAESSISNPWTDLSPSDTDGKRGLAFTPDQEKAVLAAARKIGLGWYQICIIMRHTGLRYVDVAHLLWSDIQDGVIRITPNKTKSHGITVSIPIVEQIRDAISELPINGDYLFPMHAEVYGDSWRTKTCGLSFNRVLKEAGITGPGYTVHSWRHTAATRLAEAGVSIETRMRILGHTDQSTAARYDHAEHLDEIRAALEATTRKE